LLDRINNHIQFVGIRCKVDGKLTKFFIIIFTRRVNSKPIFNQFKLIAIPEILFIFSEVTRLVNWVSKVTLKQ